MSLLIDPAGQEADIREFFSLPIPHAVWSQTKKFRDPETIAYVESLLTRHGLP